MKSVSLVIALYVKRTLMLNGSFIVRSSRLILFTIVEVNDAKSPIDAEARIEDSEFYFIKTENFRATPTLTEDIMKTFWKCRHLR